MIPPGGEEDVDAESQRTPRRPSVKLRIDTARENSNRSDVPLVSSPLLPVHDIIPLPSPIIRSNTSFSGSSNEPLLVDKVQKKKYHGLNPQPQWNKSSSYSRSVSEFRPDAFSTQNGRSVSAQQRGITENKSWEREWGPAFSSGTVSMQREQSHAKSPNTAEEREKTHPTSLNGAPTYTAVKSVGPSGKLLSYKIIRSIGKGTFSNVYLAAQTDEHSETVSSPVAIKIVDFAAAGDGSADRVEAGLEREVEILSSIQHPNVIQLIGFSKDEERAMLVMTCCPGGDLFELATTAGHLLTSVLLKRIIAETSSALCYLHRNNIVHRDVKLESM